MPQNLRPTLGAVICLLLAACQSRSPKPSGEFGVHVASALSDTASAHFTVHIDGTLQLGIRSRIVAMEPDSSLLLSTPADVVVNEGLGSVVVAAADSGVVLVVTPLDRADSAHATARAHAIRVARVGDTRHLTAMPDTDPPPSAEVPR